MPWGKWWAPSRGAIPDQLQFAGSSGWSCMSYMVPVGATASCATVAGDRDWPALSAAAPAMAQVLCNRCQHHVLLSYCLHSSLQISLILLSQTNMLVCVEAWDYPIPTSFHTLWKQLRANSRKAYVYKQAVPSRSLLQFVSRGLNWKKIKNNPDFKLLKMFKGLGFFIFFLIEDLLSSSNLKRQLLQICLSR